MHATIPFVNREEELRVLEKMSYTGRYLPLYIYGPEGCDRTRLLREFVNKAKAHRDFVVYVDALEDRGVGKAITGSCYAEGVVRAALEVLGGVVSGVAGVLARSILVFVEKLTSRISLKDKRLIVLVDDSFRSKAIE